MDKADPSQERRRAAHSALDGPRGRKSQRSKTFDIDTLLKLRPLEDRVYRHRCVEAWSMVIPWVGYSLSEFIKQCDPLPSAKYVQFLSYYDKQGGEVGFGQPRSPGLTPKGCAWTRR